MRPIAQTFRFGLVIALSVAAAPLTAVADPPPADVAAPHQCTGGFAAAPLRGEPNAVHLSLVDPARPFAGRITAYGADRKWTGTIGRSSEVEKAGLRIVSVTVRADASIEGVEYTPASTDCSFVAPVGAYGVPRDVNSPTLVLGDAQPVAPLRCARPYAAATVKQAYEPMTPSQAWRDDIQGLVSVVVLIDEHGVPQWAKIASSPSVVLNAPSLEAAKRSVYSPAVFRCDPVPGTYEFVVEYGPH